MARLAQSRCTAGESGDKLKIFIYRSIWGHTTQHSERVSIHSQCKRPRFVMIIITQIGRFLFDLIELRHPNYFALFVSLKTEWFDVPSMSVRLQQSPRRRSSGTILKVAAFVDREKERNTILRVGRWGTISEWKSKILIEGERKIERWGERMGRIKVQCVSSVSSDSGDSSVS